jgi:hypothetical protein
VIAWLLENQEVCDSVISEIFIITLYRHNC